MQTVNSTPRGVVITLPHDTLQPSGQSVTLQAMACATRRCSLHERFVEFVRTGDGENVRLIPPAQPQALAKAVRALLSDRAAAERLGETGRRYVVERGNIAGFARGIEAVCQRAIAEA